MAGCFAAFTLVYMGFTKLFPVISIWELEDEAAEAAAVSVKHAEVRRPLVPTEG